MAAAPVAPPQVQQPPSDTQLAAQAAIVLGTAITVADGMAALAPLFLLAGLRRPALQGALTVVMSLPPDQLGPIGPATRNTAYLNLARRAQYLIAATRRIGGELASAQSRGITLEAAYAAAVRTERRYYGQHLIATWNRMDAAARVDVAARDIGVLLGWHAVLDRNTSAECKAANGKNFYATSVPLIGYPGAVHPHCRCYPGRPYRGARLLPSATIAA